MVIRSCKRKCDWSSRLRCMVLRGGGGGWRRLDKQNAQVQKTHGGALFELVHFLGALWRGGGGVIQNIKG